MLPLCSWALYVSDRMCELRQGVVKLLRKALWKMRSKAGSAKPDPGSAYGDPIANFAVILIKLA